MNKKQLCDCIGNIDDRLVEQAEHIPDYRGRHRRNIIRRIAAFAAIVTLMICSFSAGAMAFAKENVVKVLVESESVTLEEIGLTLILPDHWKGQYSVKKMAKTISCTISRSARVTAAAQIPLTAASCSTLSATMRL